MARGVIRLLRVTAPSWRYYAGALFFAGFFFLAMMETRGTDLWCVRHERVVCTLDVHSALVTRHQTVEVPAGVTVRSTDNPLPLTTAIEWMVLASDGAQLTLSSQWRYSDEAGRWQAEGSVQEAARRYFMEAQGRTFHIEARPSGAEYGNLFFGLFVLGAVFLAEQRTRVYSLLLDLASGRVVARLRGLQQPTEEVTSVLGLHPRFEVDPVFGQPAFTTVAVRSDGHEPRVLWTARDEGQRAALDALVADAKTAMETGQAPRMRWPWLRSMMAAGLVLGTLSLVALTLAHGPRIAPTMASLRVTNTADQCTFEGITLMAGGTLTVQRPPGPTPVAFTVTTGNAGPRTVTRTFALSPTHETRFDCGELVP